MRIRPGSIIQLYDASFIADLKADTPFVSAGERHPRQFFYATKAYENHIHTPTEHLLRWQPWGIVLTVLTLLGAIVIHIVQLWR